MPRTTRSATRVGNPTKRSTCFQRGSRVQGAVRFDFDENVGRKLPDERLECTPLHERLSAGHDEAPHRALSNSEKNRVDTLNYDELSARTDTVTSGISADLKTCYVHHRAQRAPLALAPVITIMRHDDNNDDAG